MEQLSEHAGAVRRGLAGVTFLCLAAAILPLVGCPPNTDSATGSGLGSEQTPQAGGSVTDAGTSAGNGTASQTGGIIADHHAVAAFANIPTASLNAAQANYRIFYGHTSHGSQIVTGMEMVAAEDSRFAFKSGTSKLSLEEESLDLGHVWDLPEPGWVDATNRVLSRAGGTVNMVMWSWCGGVSDNTPEGIAAYCERMDQFERDYPNVIFVYMTGHLDGTGDGGDLRARNNQIRAYCRTHDKILFDFADIESYDPAGNYYANGTDWCEWCEDWCASQACPSCDECAHSVCFNCYQKGKAFWWMMARIAGWDGN